MATAVKRKSPVFIVISTLVLSTLMIASFFVAEDNGVFRVSKIQLEMKAPKNLYWADRKQELEIELAGIEKQNIWSFSIGTLKGMMNRSGWIETFQVYRTLPNKVTLEVTPRSVVGNLLDDSDQVQPLTSEGKLLKTSALLRAPIRPVVVVSKADRSQINLKELSSLLSSVPEKGAFSLENIDEVTFDKTGAPWLHIYKWKWDIRIEGTKRDLKISRVSEVAEYLKSQELTDRVIDAGFTQKVLVRPRKRR